MSTPAIAHLVDADTESEPEEAPSEAEEFQSLGSRVPLMSEEFEASEPSGTRTILPYSSASSDSTTPLSPDHPLTQTSPNRAPFHRRTARMAVRVQAAMLPEDEGHGSEKEDDAILEGQQQATPVINTAAGDPLRLGYRAMRRHELAVGEGEPTLVTWMDPEDGRVYIDIPAYVPRVAPVQTPPSPEWSSGSMLVSPSSPAVPTTVASPATSSQGSGFMYEH
ncbi:hypothetical protein Tco_0961522 [Tanacetum coccineum]